MEKKNNSFKYIIIVAAFLFGLYFAAHLGYALDKNSIEGKANMEVALEEFMANVEEKPFIIFENFYINIKEGKQMQSTILMYASLMSIFLLYQGTGKKKYMKGKEHGTAEWGTMNEAKKLADEKDPSNNVIISQNVLMSLNTRQTLRNLNQVTLGGSGTGKTRFEVKPNIMQANTSYIITDPKGEILRDTGGMLEKFGYKIKVFNIKDMTHSCNYNPMAYIDYYKRGSSFADKDIIKLINTLMKNTSKDGKGASDPFWDNAERTLLLSIISYLYYEAPKEEQNFGMVIELIRCAKVSEEDENFESILDSLMQDLEKENPEHIAVKYYGDFKQAAGKTAKSIIISALARLGIFAIPQVVDLMCIDTIDIPKIGEEKTALYVIIPDSDDTFNCIVAMLYTQLFDILYDLADLKYQERLPLHVRCHLDEFANIGIIPNFEKLLATMRSREISANIIIQNISQLKTIYKDSWETIIGNCDTFLFLGGKEPSSKEFVTKMLGKATIDTLSRNESKSAKSNSVSKNEGILGRDLMSTDELEKMNNKYCLVFIRGYNPFKDLKFNIKKHKRYKMIGDFDKKNRYQLDELHTTTSKEAKLLYAKANDILINGDSDEEILTDKSQLAQIQEGDLYLQEDEEKEQLIGDILASKVVIGSTKIVETYDEKIV